MPVFWDGQVTPENAAHVVAALQVGYQKPTWWEKWVHSPNPIDGTGMAQENWESQGPYVIFSEYIQAFKNEIKLVADSGKADVPIMMVYGDAGMHGVEKPSILYASAHKIQIIRWWGQSPRNYHDWPVVNGAWSWKPPADYPYANLLEIRMCQFGYERFPMIIWPMITTLTRSRG